MTDLPEITAKLAESSLDWEDAKQAKLSALSPRETNKLNGKFTCPSLLIPYFTAERKPRPNVWRARLFLPTGAYGEKPKARYTQPTNVMPSVYFPLLGGVDWVKYLDDPEKFLLITEGELKSITATKFEFPCISVGGVWNFKSKRWGFGLIPELQKIRCKVGLCYDSDAKNNPNICFALATATDELRRQGVETSIVTIPPLSTTAKTGLDDFLTEKGADALTELIAKAQTDALGPELWRMNSRYSVIGGGIVHDELTGETCSLKTFVDVRGNLWADKLLPTGKAKAVQVAKEWKDWEQRQTYESMTYLPGKPRVIPGIGDGQLNVYRPHPIEAIKGDVTPWLKLRDHLFQGSEPGAKEWFEQWCAFPFANPGVKIFSAVGMWSIEHGVGKSMLSKTLSALYGGNFQVITQDKLEGNFNSWIVNKQFVAVEEMTGSDSRAKAAILKSLITEPMAYVNKKFVPEYSVPTCANFYLTSNDNNAFFVEDHDRRYFIHEVTSGELPEDFRVAYVKWLESKNGPGSLLYHFTHDVDLSDFSPHRRPPMTQMKLDMIRAVKGELATWLSDVKEDPDTLVFGAMKPNRDIYTAQELTVAFNSVCKGHHISADTMGRVAVSTFKRATSGKVGDGPRRGRYFVIRGKWAKASIVELSKHLKDRPDPWK